MTKKKARRAKSSSRPGVKEHPVSLGSLDEGLAEKVSEGGDRVGQASALKQVNGDAVPDLREAPKPKKTAPRPDAKSMAGMQREISVSEFFQKNRHLLGFDNPRKAILTAIKEAVDNSLDACEEARLLPDLRIEIRPTKHEDRFTVVVEDSGPGIVKAQLGRIFGKLLYGSKFHRLKMSRGQQGIGISAAGMYGQLTTGKPICITSRTGPDQPAHYVEILMNTTRNEPQIIRDDIVEWDKPHGTRVELELLGRYQKGRQSVDEYLEETAVANPHVRMEYLTPDGQLTVFERGSDVLPEEPREIKPHPHGVELGLLIKMIKDSRERTISSFFQSEFSRVSLAVAKEICDKAKVSFKARPTTLAHDDVDALYRAINETKLMAPPTNCLSPIGQDQILAGLKKQIKADFYAAVSRKPSVYRGNPFLVEAGLAWGGEQDSEGLCRLLRYANRVPLLYQQSACAVYDGVVDTQWRNYHVQQSRGALPSGPLTIMVHFASAWVPFTSESKEAIADYTEITKEIRLALQECGRQMSLYLRRKKRLAEVERKKSYIEKYIPHIAIGLREILGFPQKEEDKIKKSLREMLEKKSANGTPAVSVSEDVGAEQEE